MSITDIFKLLEANPIALVIVALPLSLFVTLKLISFLMSDKEDDSVQTLIQGKLIEFASRSIETTELLRKAYEENTVLQAKHIDLQAKYNEQVNVASTILARIAQRLDEHDMLVDDRLKNLSQPILTAVKDISLSLIKTSTTKVMIRNSSGKVVSTFVAQPHKINGEEVIVIDILGVKNESLSR